MLVLPEGTAGITPTGPKTIDEHPIRANKRPGPAGPSRQQGPVDVLGLYPRPPYDIPRLRKIYGFAVIQTAAENSFDSILVTDTSRAGKIIYANTAFTKLTGHSPADVMGKTPRILQGIQTANQETDDEGAPNGVE
jgi:PAS domain-containing protein